MLSFNGDNDVIVPRNVRPPRDAIRTIYKPTEDSQHILHARYPNLAHPTSNHTARMPTYAILGATGQTGTQIVKYLLPTTNHLNIYVRSQAKLISQFPEIDNAENVTLFVGELHNTTILNECIANADVILSTVAQNRNEPGCSIAQRSAFAIIQALESKRSAGKCPTVVFLASGAIDPHNPHRNELSYRFIHWVLHHIYDDLEAAVRLFQVNPWIPLVIACASGLIHQDTPHSVELTTDITKASQLQSYSDLAKGMIDMGKQGEVVHGNYVSMIVNEGKPIGGNPAALLRYLLPNLLASVCPPLWWLGKDLWPA